MRVNSLSYSNLRAINTRYGSFVGTNDAHVPTGCSLYGSEHEASSIINGGRFAHYVPYYIENGYEVERSCSSIKRQTDYNRFMEQLLVWIAINCQDDLWTMRLDRDKGFFPIIHIIFRNPTAAILFKFVWSNESHFAST